MSHKMKGHPARIDVDIPAKAAFEAFIAGRDERQVRNESGQVVASTIGTWDTIGDISKDAWRRVAHAVIAAIQN